MVGSSPFGARRGNEPDRPSAWWRRRSHLWRPPSCHAVGQADQGQEDPAQQGDGSTDRPAPAQALAFGYGGRLGTLRLERAVCRRLPSQEGRGSAQVRTQSGDQDVVASIDDLSAIRRTYFRRL